MFNPDPISNRIVNHHRHSNRTGSTQRGKPPGRGNNLWLGFEVSQLPGNCQRPTGRYHLGCYSPSIVS